MKNDLKILKKIEEINQKTECYINQVKTFNPDASTDRLIESIVDTAQEIDKLHKERFNIAEKTVIKTQEQEKENAYIEKIITMMKQKDCVLRYIESEDCFAVKTILSDGWYKLTPEFVENNVREEIKPLPLIEKNKQLKAENAEYKRVLKIMFGKKVSIFQLSCCKNVNEYNDLKFKDNEKLTEEEFDTLKRWSKCQR